MSSYSRHHPFFASIKERYPLSQPGSQRNTHHITLDISGSGITYAPGDSVGIFPWHDPEIVQKTLQAAKATGKEMVRSRQELETWSLADYLTTRANITEISPKLFREVMARQSDPHKKRQLEELAQSERPELLKAYLEQHHVWDFLMDHQEVLFSAQELVDLLMPLLPRFYSISSSQKWVGDEIHLAIAAFAYESNGHERHGVCTRYLCHLAPLHQPNVPMFVQPSHGFALPSNPHAPLIMVGPGTGVAPFRAFLQERILHGNSAGKHWLFFGEWQRAYDFFYEQDWQLCGARGHLRLDLAFSRDQMHKVYVQHKMLENGQELFQWLEEGAYFYVCGDARQMAKDVDAALQAIVQEYGRQDAPEAKAYLKQLRHQKRYLRDVY